MNEGDPIVPQSPSAAKQIAERADCFLWFHSWGRWEDVSEKSDRASYSAEAIQKRYCVRCGKLRFGRVTG